MTGSLEGCLYTKVITSKSTPGGVYLESGEGVFIGTLDGGPAGTFATTYKFESKWDPDVSSGVEVRGRCHHPIVKGSGTGGTHVAYVTAELNDRPRKGLDYDTPARFATETAAIPTRLG
jgi:hypothetical protein